MISLDVTLTVGGVDLSAYVVSAKRTHAICRPGQALSIEIRNTVDHSTILPWDAVVFKEQGVLVFTGYVTSVDVRRSPSSITLECSDVLKRATCTLIDRGIKSDGVKDVAYWVDYFCGISGLTYQIDSPNSDLIVVEGISFELQMASECLFTLASYAGWVIRVEPDGTLRFFNIAVDVDRVVESIEWSREASDENARNECVIWGLDDVHKKVTRVLDGIGAGRTMVFANPAINTEAMADYIAQFALDQFCSLDDVLTLSLLGNPSVLVGEIMSIDLGSFGYYANTITDTTFEISKSGYRLTMACGRKCLRLPALPISSSGSGGDVYVGTTNALGRSRDFYYTSGSSVVWENADPNGVIGGGITSMNLDRFLSASYGYVTTGSGIFRATNLFKDVPTWMLRYSASNFQTATGVGLSYFANIKPTPAKQGVLYTQAVGVDGNVYVGYSSTYGANWSWSGAISNVGSGQQTLGFEVSPYDYKKAWTAGSGGDLLGCTSGSGLSFSFISTQLTNTPIRNIMVPRMEADSVIWIGGDGNVCPFSKMYGGGTLTYSYYLVSNVTWTEGAPDGNWGGFKPGAYIYWYPVIFSGGTYHTYNYAAVRFYAKDTAFWDEAVDGKYWQYKSGSSYWNGSVNVYDWIYSQKFTGVMTSAGTSGSRLATQWFPVYAKNSNALTWLFTAGYDAFNHTGWLDAVEFAFSDTSGSDAFNNYHDGSTEYIRVSFNSGGSFNDVTPTQGGATTMNALATNNQWSGRVQAISSGSYVVFTTSNGAPWTQEDSNLTGANNVVVHPRNFARVYYLDDLGIHYTPDNFATHLDKTGNWSDTFGTSFGSSGSKVAFAPVMV